MTFQAAYLLHSRPYQDHKLLADFLTEQGKISAVVYNGKTQKSNKNGFLQPFSELSIRVKGHGTLKTLSTVEALSTPFLLKGIWLYSGLYINELLVRLITQQQGCAALYDSYRTTMLALQRLQQTSSSQQLIEITLRQFEMALLSELGLSIDFSSVFTTTSDLLYYHYELGFLDQQQATELLVESPKIMQELSTPLLVTALKDLAQSNLSSSQTLSYFKQLTRYIFSHLLGNKPLKSRQLFIKKDYQ